MELVGIAFHTGLDALVLPFFVGEFEADGSVDGASRCFHDQL